MQGRGNIQYMTKSAIAIVLVAFLAAGGALAYIHSRTPQITNVQFPSAPVAVTPATPATPPASSTPAMPAPTSATPTTLNLKVPFTAQAPTGNWDQLHNEACEEATALMANAYLTGNTSATLSAAYVEQQISLLTDWQVKNFGYSLDTTSAQTAQMITAVYGLKATLLPNFTADDLKSALQAGHPVLISEAGQLLGNPNYKSPGPVHHMLLIRGYTPEGFITNDSGTRNGQNYFYTFATIDNAAADWSLAAKNVDRSQKIAIIVSK